MVDISDTKARIAVVSATFNAAMHLPALIESLLAQTSREFVWVVADGGSTDGTLALIDGARNKGLEVLCSSQPDFGIYDALNRAIRMTPTEYYLILGADDLLYPEAIATFKQALLAAPDSPDIITAGVHAGEQVMLPLPGQGWKHGMREFVSAHTVGSLYRRDLHQQYGFFSRKFPLAADQLFVKTVGRANTRIQVLDSVVVGRFGIEGVSSVDLAGRWTEFFRTQLLTGENKTVQLLLLIYRLLQSYRYL